MAIVALQADPGTPMREMNTTPLIDVLLVILVMFIIALPLQTHVVKVDLPCCGGYDIEVVNRIGIDEGGVITWNRAPISQPALARVLQQTRAMQPTPELQFEPHPNARYIIVDQVLAVIKRTGVGGAGFIGNERYAREF